MNWIIYLLISIILSIFIVVFIYNRKYEKQRTEFLSNLAQKLNLEFSKIGPIQLIPEIRAFKLLNKGRNPKLNNLMYGDTENVSVKIFDYTYVTGSGKNRSTISNTVLFLESNYFKLPHFMLSPEFFFSRVMEFFGMQDIDFENYPEFSKKYLLKGEDEMAIRQHFKRDLILKLNDMENLSMEGKANQLIIYMPRRKLKKELIETFFRNGLQIAHSLMG